MCGIVGADSLCNVTPILLEGLKRLEYCGYDSAGIACAQRDEWWEAALRASLPGG